METKPLRVSMMLLAGFLTSFFIIWVELIPKTTIHRISYIMKLFKEVVIMDYLYNPYPATRHRAFAENGMVATSQPLGA